MTTSMSYVYNFDTGRYDTVSDLRSVEDLTPYVPRITGARELFSLYIETGDDKLEAMKKVLEQLIGVR